MENAHVQQLQAVCVNKCILMVGWWGDSLRKEALQPSLYFLGVCQHCSSSGSQCSSSESICQLYSAPKGGSNGTQRTSAGSPKLCVIPYKPYKSHIWKNSVPVAVLWSRGKLTEFLYVRSSGAELLDLKGPAMVWTALQKHQHVLHLEQIDQWRSPVSLMSGEERVLTVFVQASWGRDRLKTQC